MLIVHCANHSDQLATPKIEYVVGQNKQIANYTTWLSLYQIVTLTLSDHSRAPYGHLFLELSLTKKRDRKLQQRRQDTTTKRMRDKTTQNRGEIENTGTWAIFSCERSGHGEMASYLKLGRSGEVGVCCANAALRGRRLRNTGCGAPVCKAFRTPRCF